MDESFRGIMKYLVLPKAGPEEIKLTVTVILLFVVLLILYEILRRFLERRRELAYILKAAKRHELTNGERDLILSVAAGSPRINPKLVFASIREFHRLFGPMMHDLTEKATVDQEAHLSLERLFALRKKLFGEVNYHFGRITSTIQLKIGLKISLEFSHEGQSITANTVILDIDEAAITVANTSQNREYIRFVKGDRFRVSFFRENDGYYQFETQALRNIDPKSPLCLLLAHGELVQRVQSRKFYRMTASIPFKFRRYAWDDNLENRYIAAVDEILGDSEGLILDISAGGLLFSTNEELAKNDLLLLHLSLNPEVNIQDLLGKVVEIDEQKTPKKSNLIHLQFLNIKSGEQDLIVRMIQQHKLQEEA
ncbi:MAG TPA: flagellar brake protein [archaeon]|nr:flagellar brake protein [archaeon]